MQEHSNGSGNELPDAQSQRRAMLAGLGGLAAGALLSSGRSAHAGPLNPPPGPIEPTMKRLDEVEPRIPINSTTAPGTTNAVHRILLPGSYYLTGDIVGEPSKSGIQIAATAAAGYISIDLNGYRIRGVDGSFVGISCLGTNPRLVIRNGQISGWGWNGVNANCPMVLEDLRVEGNGQGQASHGGARGGETVPTLVRRCVFAGNDGDGLVVGSGSRVERVDSESNGRTGIIAGEGTTVRDCRSALNAMNGIMAGDKSSITNCMCGSNINHGITVASRCVISENMCDANQCYGILVEGSENIIKGNISSNNGCPVLRVVGPRNILIQNYGIGDIFSVDIDCGQSCLIGPVWSAAVPSNADSPQANYRV